MDTHTRCLISRCFQKSTADSVGNKSRKQSLPKSARLPSILPGDSENGGDGENAWEFVDGKNTQEHSQHQRFHVQSLGIPWSPEQFVRRAVKAGHPMLLQACLPSLLKELVRKYHSTSTLDRAQHRISRVKHWMARAKQLEEDGRNKSEVCARAIGYEDMGVVKEFTEGSHLVGTCDVTGLWPKKFAAITLAHWC